MILPYFWVINDEKVQWIDIHLRGVCCAIDDNSSKCTSLIKVINKVRLHMDFES